MSIAASPIAKNNKKLYIYDAVATSILESNPYAFKTYLDFERGCAEIGSYWKSIGVKKAGTLKIENELGELCLRGARMVYPSLYEAAYSPGEDVSTHLLVMKKRGIEAVFNVGYEADMMNMLKSMKTIEYRPAVGVAEPDALTAKVIKDYGDYLEGTTAFGFPEVSLAFINKIKTKYPDRTFARIEDIATTFIHIKQVAVAIEGCARDDIDCQVKQLARSKPDSTMSFKGWVDRKADYNFSLKVWKNGKLRRVRLL